MKVVEIVYYKLTMFTQTGHRSVDKTIQNVRSQMDKVKIQTSSVALRYFDCLGLEEPNRS